MAAGQSDADLYTHPVYFLKPSKDKRHLYKISYTPYFHIEDELAGAARSGP